jgi:hypothetical protein
VEVSPWLSREEIIMKPTVVADEMFPEGAGSFMDLEEVRVFLLVYVEYRYKHCHIYVISGWWIYQFVDGLGC